MSTDDDRHGGIPTRAIHEAYLDMQRALKRYRKARDTGNQHAVDDAHGDVQETVLTLYELLRPHLKHNDAVGDYWTGEPPRYTGNGPPDPEDGKGVIDWQKRTTHVKHPGGDPDTFEDWHDALGLNGSKRLLNVVADGNACLVQYHAYEIGLRRLDEWQTEIQTTQKSLGGFLDGVTKEEKKRERVKIHKLRRAARELSDVAERLNALSEFEGKTHETEITSEDIERVDEYRKRIIDE